MAYNPSYPSVSCLKQKAKSRVPSFAFDYLEGGCANEVGLNRNYVEMQQVVLQQHFIRPVIKAPKIKATFAGIAFDAPVGIAPIGLQGLIWPNAPIILAKSAKKYNIPYILSTVSTSTIEEVAKASDGEALFQLYNPEDTSIRDDLIRRAKDVECRALIVTADIASFGYRPRDIRNGLSIPPKINLSSIVQTLKNPLWSWNMMCAGFMPELKTLTPYMDSGKDMMGMAQFMNDKMMGGVSEEELKAIRHLWQGPLIVKGVLSERDVERCIALGADGVIVSNHGARQLDNGQTAISALPNLVKKYGEKIDISFDSGIQSGGDVVGALASGAQFTFCGRSFVYGVAALGDAGGDHTIEMFQKQITQTMCQIGCDDIKNLPEFLGEKTL